MSNDDFDPKNYKKPVVESKGTLTASAPPARESESNSKGSKDQKK